MRPRCSKIPVDDGAVLLDVLSGQRRLVNRTALEVWHELRRDVDDDAVVASIAGRHGLAPELVEEDLRASLTALRAFAAGAPSRTSHATPSAWVRRPAGVRSTAIDGWRWIGSVGPFSALGHRFVVRADDRAVLDAAESLFGALRAASDSIGPDRAVSASVTYSVRSRPGRRLGASLWSNDQPVRFAPDTHGALARLAWLINAAAVDACGGLPLHAAAVARSGQVLVIAGESGAGKSTLAATLAIDGFEYLGDEITVVGPDHIVAGLPSAAKLSPPSLAAIGVDDDAAIWIGGEAHVRPDRLRAGSAIPCGRLAAVVLPRYDHDASWVTERLDSIDAAQALLPCVFAARPFTQADADLVGSIATTIPVHRIEYADLAAPVAFVRHLLP